MLKLIVTISILISQFTFASLLTNKEGTKNIGDSTAFLHTEFNQGNTKATLRLAGAGIRTKKIALFRLNVYLAEWFVNETKPWKKSIDHLDEISPVAMRMTFLRDVETEKMESAFRDAFKVNKIQTDDPTIKKFLSLVLEEGQIKKGSSMTLSGVVQSDKSEKLIYESGSGKISEIIGPAGFLKQIFSIWFGEVSEDTLLELKKLLIGLD